MKKLFFILICCFVSQLIFAQHTAYYQNALGKNGAQLKTALHNIIDNHNVLSWPLWSHFYTTDNKSGKLWDVYSDIPGGAPTYTYNLGSDECGQYNSEGDCYNHEHLWPKSYFNDALPMANDLHHIYPTDGWVNNKRGSLPFGEVTSVDWTSQNGTKVGSSNTYSGYNGDVFEPIDSFKGDIARVMFYTTTRYEGEDNGWNNWTMANKAVLKQEAIDLFLQWHNDDPVSQKEIDRNDAVEAKQGNRNPFIDYPQFANCIWGALDCTPLNIEELVQQKISVYPNPAMDEISITLDNVDEIKLFNMMGKQIASFSSNRMNITSFSKGFYFIQIAQKHSNKKYYSSFIKL